MPWLIQTYLAQFDHLRALGRHDIRRQGVFIVGCAGNELFVDGDPPSVSADVKKENYVDDQCSLPLGLGGLEAIQEIQEEILAGALEPVSHQKQGTLISTSALTFSTT